MPYRDEDVVILDGARTPIGTFCGALSGSSATALGVVAAREAIARADIDAEALDATIVGNVLQADADAAYIARHVGLEVGAPVDSSALTVNRLCGSGLEALVQAAKAIRLGEAHLVLAGGAETMSRVPHALRGTRKGWGLGRGEVEDVLFAALYDRLAGCQIGQTVEHLAAELDITREECDAFALQAHHRAAAAVERGRLALEIAPVAIEKRGKTRVVDADEGVRFDVSADGLAALRPIYGGVSTAGNSTGLNDAAAMLVVASGAAAKAHGLEVLGRVVSWASVGVEPKMMGLGPVPASRRAMDLAGLRVGDLDVVEINDSFAAQYIAVEGALGLDREVCNVNGGGVSLGHPMGATGARLVLSALYELKERGASWGLATLCVGGGQGTSVVVERA